MKNAGQPSGFGAASGSNATIDVYNGALLGVESGSSSDRKINLVSDGAGTVTVTVNVNGGGTIGGVTATGTGAKTLKFLDTSLYTSNPGWLIVSGGIPDVSDGSRLSINVPFTFANINNALTLNGTNTFSGPITIGGTYIGQFKIGGSGSLGAGTYTNRISVGSGCVFHYASSVAQLLTGAVSGAGELRVSGGGTLTLSAVSNSVGNVMISTNGILQIAGGIGDSWLYVTNNINVPSGATNNVLGLDIRDGGVSVNVAGTLVYAGTHKSYLKITGGGQKTPVISCGGAPASFDYVIYNNATSTWAAAQVPGALSGYGGKTQLRIAGGDIYIDPLPPKGTAITIR
jgi:hypothetical protein